MLSVGVKLQDFDFLTPSSVCIKPTPKAAPEDIGRTVKVDLTDCLACSGCVTSAESMLVQLQSVDELYAASQARTEGKCKYFVISIAPQVTASVAAYYRCDPRIAFGRISSILRRKHHVDAVVDTLWGHTVALTEAAAEFVHRFCAAKRLPVPESVRAPQTPASSAEGLGPLPVLAGACPGWVCYAEKARPELLPHIASAKSPQAALGTLIKRWVCEQLKCESHEVYHLSIASCYDKKLEASREQLRTADGARETDCVLSAGEILTIIAAENEAWESLPVDTFQEAAQGLLRDECFELGASSNVETSGGYLDFIYRFTAFHVFGQRVEGPLPLRQKRNANYQEVLLRNSSGDVVLNFALAYGFQQIQNIARMLNSGKCQHDFVEVMACPSGCLNGGGQIRADQQLVQPEDNKQLLQRVTQAYETYLAERRKGGSVVVQPNVSVASSSSSSSLSAEKSSDVGAGGGTGVIASSSPCQFSGAERNNIMFERCCRKREREMEDGASTPEGNSEHSDYYCTLDNNTSNHNTHHHIHPFGWADVYGAGGGAVAPAAFSTAARSVLHTDFRAVKTQATEPVVGSAAATHRAASDW